MNRIWILMLLASMAGQSAVQAAAELPPFDEVFGLVRSNLAGARPADLNEAAVSGLLEKLSPRVALAEPSSSSTNSTIEPVRAKVDIFRDDVGYIHLSRVGAEASERLKAAYAGLTSTNTLSGLVLDLRFVDGNDYAEAVAVVDLFLARETPLLNWGEGLKSSQAKQDAIPLPVVVLMNARTGEAAEALAAMLRQSGVALLLGGRTAGTAGIMKTFPMSNGESLRITVANVQLGDAKTLDTSGVQPDVPVSVSLTNEQHYVENPYYSANPAGPSAGNGGADTNAVSSVRRSRTDEAELVRRWRGQAPSATGDSQTATQTEQIHDPVLLRALDLMEGLAILRSWQR